MENNIKSLAIDHYANLVLKYRWLIIIPLYISMAIGIYLAFILPKVYQAKTLILIQPQRVPSNFVQSIVSTSLEARISTIKQQILSRTNLEKIIKEYDIFSKPEHEKMYLEDKLSNLRKRIDVEVTKVGAKTGADAFSISFIGEEPERVMKVANTLASYFINENLKVREAQAIGTSDFLDNERTIMLKRLEEVEEKLKIYRKQNMGELPEQLETNLRILDRLQQQLSEKQERFSNVRYGIITSKNRIKKEQSFQSPVQPDQSEEKKSSELDRLKENLAALQTKYTDRHPDVIKTKKLIASFENHEESSTKEQNEAVKIKSDFSKPSLNNDMTAKIEMIKREKQALEREIEELSGKIRVYEKRVENTPKREQELLSLKRDYDNIQATYSSLLTRKLEAEIAVNMERRQKGEQFRILDSATIPEKPILPDLKNIFIFSLSAGLCIGAGLIFLIDFLDTSFKKPKDVTTYMGLSILAVLPPIKRPGDKKKQRVNNVLSVISIFGALVMCSGFAVLAIKGVDQTIGLIKKLITI